MNALAQAVQLLQYSTPSDSSDPGRTQYTYGVQVTVTSVSGACTTLTIRSSIPPRRPSVRLAGRSRCPPGITASRCPTRVPVPSGPESVTDSQTFRDPFATPGSHLGAVWSAQGLMVNCVLGFRR